MKIDVRNLINEERELTFSFFSSFDSCGVVLFWEPVFIYIFVAFVLCDFFREGLEERGIVV